jgi:hypothetical protein
MQFLLIDIGATLAAFLGYRAFEVLRRHQASSVTLGRMRRRAPLSVGGGSSGGEHTARE